MHEIANITYNGNGSSVTSDNLGMRPMQKKVYEKRKEQYILLKSPPASGKSRACMFIALDKLYEQGLKKVIIAVPEMSIGASFKRTDLVSHGFYYNWEPDKEYNLCLPESENGKVKKFREFLKNPTAKILICTHATLRFAYQDLGDPSVFDNCFMGIDEFHHTSADIESSRLGDMVKGLIEGSNAHILAMTGSYFRGDGIPVLEPEVENKFTSVTFSYYDQLSGYKWLKTICLSYDFYAGRYIDILEKDLNLAQKTIVHIPNVNSRESTQDKYEEVNKIIDIIGDIQYEDPNTGIYYVKAKNGKTLKVVDLVDETNRFKRQAYIMNNANDKDAIDIIIALNLAKEGFDWPPCETMITVGYRGSLTEIVQIIGRCTRDYEGKVEARFINIIAEPDASTPEVSEAVNNLLKAITASLLMEQVLVPKWNFKAKTPKLILQEPETEEGRDIIENKLEDLISAVLTDKEVIETIPKKNAAKFINKALVPRIITEKFPDLSENDKEAVRQAVVTQMVLRTVKNPPKDDGPSSDTRLLQFPNNLSIDIKELDINMIDRINPLEKAYQIISKDIDQRTLRSIRAVLDEKMHRTQVFSEPELKVYSRLGVKFWKEEGRIPSMDSEDPYERKLGQALIALKKLQRERQKRGI